MIPGILSSSEELPCLLKTSPEEEIFKIFKGDFLNMKISISQKTKKIIATISLSLTVSFAPKITINVNLNRPTATVTATMPPRQETVPPTRGFQHPEGGEFSPSTDRSYFRRFTIWLPYSLFYVLTPEPISLP